MRNFTPEEKINYDAHQPLQGHQLEKCEDFAAKSGHIRKYFDLY